MSVEAINRQREIVLMVGGHIWPVATWLDERGEDCASGDAAFAIVGPCHDATRAEFWVTLDLSEFEEVKTQ